MKQDEETRIKVIVGGGAVAEELFARGLANDRNLLSASALIESDRHALVQEVYHDYLAAGATYLTTANYHVVPGLGFTKEEIREYTRVAGRLANEARQEAGETASTVWICGSLPPLLPSCRSDRTMDRQAGYDMYLLIGEALWPFVDAYVAETMSSIAEAKMALHAVAHLRRPVMVSFALNQTGYELRSGESVVKAVCELMRYSETLAEQDEVGGAQQALAGVLFNCSQPEDIAKALKHLTESDKSFVGGLAARQLLIGGYGDRISSTSTAGLLEERLVAGAMHSALDVEIYSRFVLKWIEYDARVVGGCCGVSPRYIRHLVDSVQSVAIMEPSLLPHP